GGIALKERQQPVVQEVLSLADGRTSSGDEAKEIGERREQSNPTQVSRRRWTWGALRLSPPFSPNQKKKSYNKTSLLAVGEEPVAWRRQRSHMEEDKPIAVKPVAILNPSSGPPYPK
ncbi:hypothetical protein Taro_022932, partial [Colocasia esculenta]|nr:hypothetical protein [Colocasia esculenta]